MFGKPKEFIFSDDFYKKIIGASIDGFWVTDENGRFLDVNESYAKLVGYTREELLRMSIPDIEAVEDSEVVKAHIEKVIKSGQDRFKTRHRHKNGGLIDIEVSVNFINASSGRKLFFIFLRDITENEKNLRVLSEERERYRIITENISDVVWVTDMKLRITFISPSNFRLTGFTLEESLGMTIEDILSPESYAKAGAVIKESLLLVAKQPDISRVLELEEKHKNGSLIPVEVKANFVLNSNGQPIGILGITRDITERKKAEGEKMKSQSMLQDIIDLLPVRIFWKDNNLSYLGCNKVFAQDAGKQSPDELIGKNDFEMSWKDQAEAYRADDKKVLDSGTPELNYEEPQTTPAGDKIWLNTNKIPLKNDAGKTYGVLGTYVDITERKKMEEELKKHAEELERMNNLMVGRELKMVELKKEIEKLKS